MDAEDPGYALDCELVEVSLLRGMFAGLGCVGLYVEHTHPLSQRLHELCEVCLSC